MGRWLGSALALCAGPALAGLATTEGGAPVRWTVSEIVLHPVVPEAANASFGDTLVDAMADSARAWNDALDGCGVPRLRVARVRAGDSPVLQDEVSSVVVRSRSWCPHRSRDPEDCYDPEQAGMTHLYPRVVPGGAEDGELREADVEINAVHFDWARDPGAAARLRALLAHELGHVLGLGHPKPDEAGARDSIMYFDPLERGRPLVRKPGPSEVETLCQLYPRAVAPAADAP